MKACTVFVAQVAGKEITTIEGVGEPGKLHVLQEMFREHHGLQCGYCTPGMITRAYRLLQENPDADRGGGPLRHGRQPLPLHGLPEHREVDPRRRGGDERAEGGRGMTDQTPISREDRVEKLKGLGSSRKRVEDARFTQGKGNYVDDIKLPGMLFGDFVRWPYAHARVVSIDKDAALKVPGVLAVLTAADLAPLGLHWMPTLAGDKQMVLADGKVLFQGQEVAFVVATDRYVAADAIELVEVEYEELPVVVDPFKALEPDAPVLREDLVGQDRPAPTGPAATTTTSSPGSRATRPRPRPCSARRRRGGRGDGLLPPHPPLPARDPAAASPRWTRSTAS